MKINEFYLIHFFLVFAFFSLHFFSPFPFSPLTQSVELEYMRLKPKFALDSQAPQTLFTRQRLKYKYMFIGDTRI